ncbi:MAG: hypothetical protein PVH97_04640 [Desulfobacterales bacterium]|jgi:hypothetical protein
MNAKKENRNGRKSSAAAESNSLLISSKLMADLKNRGIMAFKQMSDDEQKRVWNWSKEVIKQYRSVLEAHPSNIRNIENLPFPKEDVQLAIKLSLPFYLSKDTQSVVKRLKTAYREIGTFQHIEDVDKRELLSRENLKRKASSRYNKTIYPLSDKYTALAVSEQKALLQDINDFVADLESIMKDNRVET